MQALAERARQGLGLGDPSFEPTSLERYHAALASADPAADWLRRYRTLVAAFAEDGHGFLTATSRLLTQCPMPQNFAPDPETRKAVPSLPAAPPSAHRHLFQPDLFEALSEQLPATFRDELRDQAELPLDMWLQAHASAKERLAALERQRLLVDAQRRKVERRAACARRHFNKEADARADIDVAQSDQGTPRTGTPRAGAGAGSASASPPPSADDHAGSSSEEEDEDDGGDAGSLQEGPVGSPRDGPVGSYGVMLGPYTGPDVDARGAGSDSGVPAGAAPGGARGVSTEHVPPGAAMALPAAAAGRTLTASSAGGGSAAGGGGPSRAERKVEKHRRLGVEELRAACDRASRKLAPLMTDFEVQEERLMGLIKWLVDSAPRLRAHLAHALLAAHDRARRRAARRRGAAGRRRARLRVGAGAARGAAAGVPI
ncbi:MAG: hypothetical protein J3K34DRAFT_163221 [Monoraphidium minutum]|nr:MAG: hypothetical protein J3K34DRAFT_163221 [Monoraphidium minutum]